MFQNIFQGIQRFLSSTIVLFKDRKYEIFLKPILVVQGVFVFAAFLFVAFSATNIFFPKHKIQTANLIKSVVTKQTTAAVAGKLAKTFNGQL